MTQIEKDKLGFVLSGAGSAVLAVEAIAMATHRISHTGAYWLFGCSFTLMLCGLMIRKKGLV